MARASEILNAEFSDRSIGMTKPKPEIRRININPEPKGEMKDVCGSQLRRMEFEASKPYSFDAARPRFGRGGCHCSYLCNGGYEARRPD